LTTAALLWYKDPLTHKTHYPLCTIDLDKLAKGKNEDFLLTFGDAELVIQYRVENALREGHPFIDIVARPSGPALRIDLCDKEGEPIRVGRGKQVYQILLGQQLTPLFHPEEFVE